jgi:hypothetical protein
VVQKFFVKMDQVTHHCEVLPWEKAEKDQKSRFVYLLDPAGNETVIVGTPGAFHSMIVDAVSQTHDIDVSNVEGAGYIYGSKVEQWHSTSYCLDTPDELKPRILELLELK